MYPPSVGVAIPWAAYGDAIQVSGLSDQSHALVRELAEISGLLGRSSQLSGNFLDFENHFMDHRVPPCDVRRPIR
ncbi:hypothetical protein BJI47_16115 [Rhodococcus sp. 1168]|nr:hypothetical protein BJI47_16115 [Rhodococcus sp. 1168]